MRERENELDVGFSDERIEVSWTSEFRYCDAMNSAPQIQNVERLSAIQIAVQQTLAVLLENGPGFSVLISSHISPEPDDTRILFEDVSQVRIESDGEASICDCERSIPSPGNIYLTCFVNDPVDSLIINFKNFKLELK